MANSSSYSPKDFLDCVDLKDKADAIEIRLKKFDDRISFKEKKIKECENNIKDNELTLDNVKRHMKEDYDKNFTLITSNIYSEVDAIQKALAQSDKYTLDSISAAIHSLSPMKLSQLKNRSMADKVSITAEDIKNFTLNNKYAKVDKVFSNIFRLNFLKGKLNTLIRFGISGVIWFIVLTFLCTFISGLFRASMNFTYLLMFLFGAAIVVLNIVYFAKSKQSVSKLLEKYWILCKIELSDDWDAFTDEYIESRMSFEKTIMDKELEEIEDLKELPKNDEKGHDYCNFVMEYMKKKVDLSEKMIDDHKDAIKKIKDENVEDRKNHDEYLKKIEKIWNNIRFWRIEETGKNAIKAEEIRNIDINDGQILPCMPYPQLIKTTGGLNWFATLEHNYKPYVLVYDESNFSSQELRKDKAKIIKNLVDCLFLENNQKLFEVTLIDFGGLSMGNTKGQINIVKSEKDLASFIEKLKEQETEICDSEFAYISEYNKNKLANEADPKPYQIVFFNDVEYDKINRENTQLFVKGEDFGFLPIMLMNNTEADDIMQADSKNFPFVSCMEIVTEDSNFAFISKNQDGQIALFPSTADNPDNKPETVDSLVEDKIKLEFGSNAEIEEEVYYGFILNEFTGILMFSDLINYLFDKSSIKFEIDMKHSKIKYKGKSVEAIEFGKKLIEDELKVNNDVWHNGMDKFGTENVDNFIESALADEVSDFESNEMFKYFIEEQSRINDDELIYKDSIQALNYFYENDEAYNIFVADYIKKHKENSQN